jgi:putative ABC transport system permease protein
MTPREWLNRLWGTFRRRRSDRDLEDELRVHLELAADDERRRGDPEGSAVRAARLRVGAVAQAMEAQRDQRSLAWLEDLARDLRFACRTLRKAPGFTAAAVVTLALGIGVNTAIFSVVNGVLLNPLPYSEPDRLVALYSRTADQRRDNSSYPNFLDWVRGNHSFSDLAAFREDGLNLIGLGQPERVPAEMVSASFFRLLGVQPILGRTFLATDDQLGAAPVALIGENFWQRKFNSSPTAIGQALALSGTAYAIIGVIPATFQYDARNFHRSDVYIPIGSWTAPGFRDRKVSMGMDVVGRLHAGVSLERADSDMQALARGLADQYPQVNKGTGVTLIPLKSDLVGPVKPLLLLLVTAVLFVFLIACVNVANLLLARSGRRAPEVAMRSALGASRSRILRQFLTESVLLALAGGALGSLTAFWGTRAALTVLPEVLLPRAQDIRVDERVLLFTLSTSVMAGVLFGLLPALRASRLDLQAALRERGLRSSGHHRTQGVFVVVEIALALVLLVGSGLMIRSLTTVLRIDPGFNSNNILVARVSFPVSITTPDHVMAVWRQMSQKFETIPGLQAASLSLSSVPMTGDFSTLPFWLDGQAKPSTPAEMQWALSYIVEADYLKVMGIPLQRGRFLTRQDHEHSSPAIVIDDQFARRYFGDQDPVGRRINIDILNITAEIVGVVGHVRQWGLDEDAASLYQGQCYLSMFQLPAHVMPLAARDTAVVFRTADAPLAPVGPIRQALEQINGQMVMYREQAMDGVISDRLATRRFSMIVLGIFAALALLMACVGIYGVISHLVGERTHEIAIRVALGAERWEISRMVLWDGAKMALAGVGIGLVAALGLTRLMSSMLFGISAHDPVTVAGVVSLLTLVAFAACYIPARRATRVDPMIALRND